MADYPTPNFRCPACNGSLSGFPPDDTCMGLRCPACGWAVVTTNPNHPAFDPTLYDMWVEGGEQDRRKTIAAVGNALCIGVKAARELLDAGRPLASGVKANEVQRLYALLRAAGISVRLRPEFRWRSE